MENRDNSKKLSFTRVSDHFNTAAKAGLSLSADALVMAMAAGVTPAYGVMAAMFLMLRTRYLREIPQALGRLLFIPFIARKKSPAPEAIQSITDEFAKAAGYKQKIKTYVYDKGMTENAFCTGDRIYVGKTLVDRLNREELRFVMAHELSHARTHDISEGYLFLPPLVGSIALMIASGAAFVAAPGVASVGAVALFFAYYKAQNIVRKSHSRQIEFRADRNALMLTGNLEAAKSSLSKIHMVNGKIEASGKKRHDKSSWFDSHPSLAERHANLEKEHAALTKPKNSPA